MMPRTISDRPVRDDQDNTRIELTIHIAETTSFAFLCVMQTASPIHSHITFASVQPRRTLHGATGADTTELEKTVEHRTVISDIIFALLFGEVVHIVGCDLVEEVDVFVGVKLRHLVLRGGFCALRVVSELVKIACARALTYIYLHFRVQTVVHDQTMGHPYAVWLHGMPGNIRIVSHVRVVEICDLLGLRPRAIEGVGGGRRRGVGVIHGGAREGAAMRAHSSVAGGRER